MCASTKLTLVTALYLGMLSENYWKSGLQQ